MGAFYSRPEWLEIVRDQEQKLVFSDFSREDALRIGLRIVELAGTRYRGNAAVCILEDDMVVFAYKMPGTTLENEWWMRRKRNAARAAGVSSLLAYLEIESGERMPDWQGDREGAFAACGGCVPIRMADGTVRGYVLVSGLAHQEDHQVIADALAEHLHKEIGSVTAD